MFENTYYYYSRENLQIFSKTIVIKLERMSSLYTKIQSGVDVDKNFFLDRFFIFFIKALSSIFVDLV